MAGQTIGRYKVEGLLGRGAMGVVYKAYDPVLDRYAAIKLMSTSGELDDELRARFFREARSAARLGNPHIIAIYDMGEDSERPFIAMEYVEGEDLKTVIKQRRFIPFRKKLEIVTQICDALHAAHLQGVVHRDIKPGNVRLNREGEVKILDFGLARLESSEMTRTGMLMGTPYYMSPEQAKGAREIDGRSDLFSVGVIFYELLSYRRPFEADTPATVCFQIIREPHAPLSDYLPGCDPDLEAIIDRALAKNPDDRFPDCEQMANAINQFLEQLPDRQDKLLRRLESVQEEIRSILTSLGGIAQEVEELGGDETLTQSTAPDPGSQVQEADNDYGMLIVRSGEADRRLRALKENLGQYKEIQVIYRASKELFDKKDWKGCLANLGKLGKDLPVTREIQSMRSICLEQLERLEADRRKRAEAEAAMSHVRNAWERGHLEACVKASQNVLRIDPDHQEAAQFNARAKDRLNKLRKLAELESAAQDAWRAGNFDSCLSAVGEGLCIDPENDDLRRMKSQAEKAIERQRQIGGLLKQAREQLAEGKYQEAITSAAKVLELDSGHAAAKQLESDARQRLERESRLAGLREQLKGAQAAGDHEKVDSIGSEILGLDPNDPEARKMQAEARAHMQRRQQAGALIARARDFLDNKNYRQAAETAREAAELAPEILEARALETEANQAARQAQITDLLSLADAKAEKGDLRAALENVERVLEVDSGNKRAVDLRKKVEAQIAKAQKIAGLLATSRQLFEQEQYAAAKEKAQSALRLEPGFPEALEITARIDRIQEALASAKRHLNERNWGTALESAEAVLRDRPADRQAAGIKAEAERGLERTRKLATTLKRAADLQQAGQYEQAIQACDEGLALEPAAAELRRIKDESQEALARQKKVEELVAACERLTAASRWADVISAADHLIELDPESKRARQFKKTAAAELDTAQRIEDLRLRARQAREKSLWSDCLQASAEGLELLPGDLDFAAWNSEARLSIERAQKVASYVAEAQKKVSKSDFPSALSLAEQALTLSPDCEEAIRIRDLSSSAIDRLDKIKRTVATAQEAIRSQDFSRAMKAIEEGLILDPADKQLVKLRNDAAAGLARQEKLGQLLNQAAEQLKRGDFSAARTTAEKAQRTDDSSERAKEIIAAANRAIVAEQAERAAAEQAERRRKANEFLKSASQAKQERDSARCSELAKQGLILTPDDAELQQLNRWAEEVLEKEQAEHERREEIARSWEKARLAMERKRHRAALRRLNVVLRLDPEDQEATRARQETLQAIGVARRRRVRWGLYAGAGLTAVLGAYFGIVRMVLPHETGAMPPPVKEEQVSPPVQPRSPVAQRPIPAGADTRAESQAADLARLIAGASRSLDAKDYGTAVQLAREALQISDANAEAKQIEQTAQTSLQDIAAGKSQVRTLLSQGRTEQALSQIRHVLELAPSDSEAAELSRQAQSLRTAEKDADAAKAEMEQARDRAEKAAAGFPDLLKEGQKAEADAMALYTNRDFKRATARFRQVRDAYARAEKQSNATLAQRRLEASREPAGRAEQAAAATQDQEKETPRMQTVNQEAVERQAAMQKAQTKADQARSRMETARQDLGVDDGEAAAEESKATGLFQQGKYDEAATAFDRAANLFQQAKQSRQAVVSAVASFAEAYNNKAVGAIQALWPSMADSTAQNFRMTFQQSESLYLTLRPTKISISADSASVLCSGSLRVTPKGGKLLEQQTDSAAFTLSRRGKAWLIERYRFSSGSRQ